MAGMDYSGLPRSRKEALAFGARHFFLGTPCLHGHLAPRYVCTAGCTQCSSERGKANRETLRVRERDRHRAKVKAAGRVLRQITMHADISKEAQKKRQAETCRRYRERNPEKRRTSATEWARQNRQQGIDRDRLRRQTDPLARLVSNIRSRIWSAIKKARAGTRKADRTIKLLGCSYADFKLHIERQFMKGMTWNDILGGKVHLDHIVPCSAFNLADPDQQRACFNYLNVRPLWAKDNLIKGAKRTVLL